MGSWRQDKRDGGGSRRAAWPPSSGRRNHSRSCPRAARAADAAIAAVATIVALAAAIEQFRTVNGPIGIFVVPGTSHAWSWCGSRLPPCLGCRHGRCWAWR